MLARGMPIRQEGAGTPLLRLPLRCIGDAMQASRIRFLVVLAATVWPVATFAQVTATSEYLARIDGDQDGRIALAEYQAWMGYAFERMDGNRDGQLTADELPGGKGKAISLAAHRESLAAMFRRQDANGDGFLDMKELAAPPR